MIGAFAAVGCIVMGLLVMLLARELLDFTSGLSGTANEELALALPSLLLRTSVLGVIIVGPLVLATGTLLTFRIAGPIYRFERFLSAVAEGRETQPCSLRRGDELRELCELINAATASARTANAERATTAKASETRAA